MLHVSLLQYSFIYAFIIRGRKRKKWRIFFIIFVLFKWEGGREGREVKAAYSTTRQQQPAASSQQPHIILFFKQLLQISLVQFPDSANYFDQVPSITHICFCFNLFTFYFFHPMHLFNILISLPSWCLVCFLRSKFIEIPTLSYIGFVSFRFTFSYGAPLSSFSICSFLYSTLLEWIFCVMEDLFSDCVGRSTLFAFWC